MPLRIAFDCDGCLADLDAALRDLSARLFDGPIPDGPANDGGGSSHDPGAPEAEPVAPADSPGADEEPTADSLQAAPPSFRALTRQQRHDLWEAVRRTENFWETLPETEPGVVARLAGIARERRWEVVFITQRPESAGDLAQIQTQRWLAAHGYDLPAVYVVKGSRGKVADALSLDVVVDDRPENCLDVKLESRARAILIWSTDFESLPPNARNLGIEPVSGAGACLDLLTTPPAEKPGLLSALKKLVGS
jgi:hypothetical protein